MQEPRIHPAIETENFPVASALLPQAWRAPIFDFYRFVRELDDIADHPQLAREEKREKLRLIRLALREKRDDLLPEWALPYVQQIEAERFSAQHGDQLWQAFWQDTEKSRYRNFAELMAYCTLSANPVGRALLEIAEEPNPNLAAADALCSALQLLNHLQDVRSDYLQRQRIYLPQAWLAEAGLAEKVLEKAQTGAKLRSVFDSWLDEIDALLRQAGHLPRSLRHRGLRWEVRVMLALARGLSRKLRKADPMAKKVKLGKLHRSLLSIGGIIGLC